MGNNTELKYTVIYQSKKRRFDLSKILPIIISSAALFLSLITFYDNKNKEVLTYNILTTPDLTSKITIDGVELEAIVPSIERVTGFIDKTAIIFYTDGEYKKVSEMPTSNFLKEIPWYKRIFPNKLTTSAGLSKFNTIYTSKDGSINYSYYFLFIKGIDASKHLHMITYCWDKQKNEVLTRNYSNIEIFQNESGEVYEAAFLKAKEDYFKLQKDLKTAEFW
ncbi:hypothetical protein JNUCC83_05385 [Vagococcus sp. JNUCC 83]